MAGLRLVSKEEIDEHVYTYTLPLIGWYFGSAGFPMATLRFGYFESWLNMWATAQPPDLDRVHRPRLHAV